ncbi:hypothetical protein [Spirillospora sp. NPDC047279]|uniref:hypothetical protein n=1 Tax=Spirillospora sp. NPDC047279 TaxID=3155478 RepID=UPI0033D0A7B7
MTGRWAAPLRDGARSAAGRVRRITRRGTPAGRANRRQLVVTALIAAGVAASAFLTGQATGEWQDMTRQETKRSAAAVEDITFVYGAEAPQAVRVALAEARAGTLGLDAALRGDDGEIERIEAASERQYVWQLRYAEKGRGTLLDGDAYRRPDGSYDLPRRLAATRAAHPDLVRLDPDDALAAGDRKARWAALCASAAVPLLACYFLTQLLERRRNAGGGDGEREGGEGEGGRDGGTDEVELIPPVPARREPRPWPGLVTGLAFVLFTVLVAPQLYFGNKEQRSQALAARAGTRLTAEIRASGALDAFRQESLRIVLNNDLKAHTREYVNLDTEDAELAVQQRALAGADQASRPQFERITTAMSRAPAAQDGVDPLTRELMGTTPADWKAGLERQGRALDAAEAASRRNNLMTGAILFAGLALSISAVAMVRARAEAPGAAALTVGAGALVAASVVTVVLAAIP